MRFLLACFSHETNTFSPVPTPLTRFCPDRLKVLTGDAAIEHYRGTETCLGGFLDVIAQSGSEAHLAVAAEAMPSRPVESAAFETVCDMITDALKKGKFDGIMLDLHGAMVTEEFDDGEGELLRRIRSIDPHIPIAVAYDMHANVFPAMVSNATIVAGYQTYPHVDMGDTGRRAANALVRMLRGEAKPVMSWGNAPMLPHVMAQGSYRSPNRELQQKAEAWEQSGKALAASLFVGFPHADVLEAGLSVVVVTDGDKALADAMVEELLSDAWEAREDFVFKSEPLEQSIARAKQMPPTDGPIVLLDHCDNCASGGTMDTTKVLAEIIRQGLEDVVFFGIYDPASVEAAIAAGIGAEVTLSIGGKLKMPIFPEPNLPLTVTGRVHTISDGVFVNSSAMGYGTRHCMGRTVVLSTKNIDIVLLSDQVEPYDLSAFTALGLDPARKRYLAIKSRVHWRAGLGPLAQEVVECSGLGVCTSDYDKLTFRKVRRPIFPLDAATERTAGLR